MLDTEAAETLMSLSAPDERKFTSPLYHEEGLPWHTYEGASSASKKRSFQLFNLSPTGHGSSLPNNGKGAYLATRSDDVVSLSLLHQNLYQPSHWTVDDQEEEDEDEESDADIDMDARSSWSSPFDGLVAVATSNQDDNDTYESCASRPISIPSSRAKHPPHKWSLSRVKEDASYIGRDCSPTGVEDERVWLDSASVVAPPLDDMPLPRVRLASICSSEGGMSDYGGLGRKHLEEFIRMEISEQELYEDNQLDVPEELKYIGSYSPEARRKRIERFLEKRKKRVWSKKVDYDVRKNFANSRLRVKGRFVKKEDEELLCQLLSYT